MKQLDTSKKFTPATIRKALASAHMQGPLNGNGYWYLIYDDPEQNIFETHSVYVNRMSELTLEQWIEEGRALLAKVKEIGGEKG